MALQILPNPLESRADEATMVRFGGASIAHIGVRFRDDGNDEADFVARLPADPDANTHMDVELEWVSTATNAGDVKWDIQFENLESAHPWNTNSFAAVQTQTTTVNGTTAAGNTTLIQLTFTQADSLAAEEMFRLRVIRDTSDVADDMVGDAYLANITITYVSPP